MEPAHCELLLPEPIVYTHTCSVSNSGSPFVLHILPVQNRLDSASPQLLSSLGHNTLCWLVQDPSLGTQPPLLLCMHSSSRLPSSPEIMTQPCLRPSVVLGESELCHGTAEPGTPWLPVSSEILSFPSACELGRCLILHCMASFWHSALHTVDRKCPGSLTDLSKATQC